MITPLNSVLQKKDVQAFKLIYKELTNQVNTVSAYEQLMAILPEIVYLEPAFQPLISGFFRDDEESGNTVTFCQKISHPNLPKFGEGIKIRSFEPQHEKENVDSTRTHKEYCETIVQGFAEEDSLNLRQKDFLHNMVDFIKKDLTIDDEEDEDQSTPLEHFYLNFGDVELQNMMTNLVSSKSDDYWDVYMDFEEINSEKLADFVHEINAQQDRDIDQQLCLQHIIDFQFEMTEK